MKKILSTFVLVAFFAVAAQAQSNDQTKQTENTPAKVVTAGTTTADDAVQPAVKKTNCAPGASSSCCKTKGKETASANEKACCSSDKKSSRAHRRAHRAEGAAETPSVN